MQIFGKKRKRKNYAELRRRSKEGAKKALRKGRQK
jgi:hypothetical protein